MSLTIAIDNEPPDRLAGLRAERERIGAEIRELRASIAKITEAETAVRQATEALESLDQAEIAAATIWASDGCAGLPPVPDMAKREELARDLASAHALAASAKGARTNLESRIADLSTKFAAVTAEVETVALAELEAERRKIRSELDAFAGQGRLMAARIFGFRKFIIDRGHEFRNQGRDDEAGNLLRWAERLAGEEWPVLEPSSASIEEAARDWAAKLAEAAR